MVSFSPVESSSTNQDERRTYEELNEFLVAPRADIRLAATQAVLQVTASPGRDGMTKLVKNGVVVNLVKNVNHPHPQIALNALQALVQLSSSPDNECSNQCVDDLIDEEKNVGGINRMVEVVLSSSSEEDASSNNNNNNNKKKKKKKNLKSWRKRVNYAMALIANMTRTESAAVDLVGRTLPEEAVVTAVNNNKKELDKITEEGEHDEDEENDPKLPPKPTAELLLSRFLNEHYLDTDVDYSMYNNKNSDYDEAEEDDDDDDDTTNVQLDSQGGDPYQHFAAVLMNITQTEAGRRFVLQIHHPSNATKTEGTCVLQRLVRQLKSQNPIRRRGVAGCIRNCCLDKDSSWWFLNVLNIHNDILYPLAGPEELDVDEKQGLHPDLWLEGPDKQRETDHLTRLFLVESILVLCTSGRKAREKLRLDRAYVVLKYADMVEPHEDVSEQIDACVQYLRRDEANTEEGSSDKFVQDAYPKLKLLTSGTAAASVVRTKKAPENDDDFDAVD